MSFQWDVEPSVWVQGMEDYTDTTFHELFALAEQWALRIQDWMRQNAPWEDACFPPKEYLKADAFYPDTWSVGIRAWYDLDLYRSQCGEPPYDFGTRHETETFSQAGVISIILPRGSQGGVLGQMAEDFMDAIRALYAGGGSTSSNAPTDIAF